MAPKAKGESKPTTAANVGYEAELWQMADALRGSMDAAEYKHVVLGLIFLKYISDAFEEQHAKLEQERKKGADPEDPDEYRALNIFWVPPEARWSHLKAQAKQPTIGQLVDDAMAGIERDNPSLKGVLPKEYARPALDKLRLGQLIDLITNIRIGDKESRSKDVLGRVYEYFLSQFASAEGKKGGEFYTPRCVVRLLVEMLEPYKGRVYDPCCGSSGMFVQSVEFINAHASGNGNSGNATGDLPAPQSAAARQAGISIYGQESNYTTWRLAKMNLAIRGIDGQIAHGDTFHSDQHPDLKADYILANPPFNVSDWRGELLKEDKRWKFGVPPAGNANFAWVQHMIQHLAPTGVAGFVLANGSMSSNQSNEGEIQKNIIEADLVDCMIALPGQLFYSTQIPACLWFIARDKRGQPSPPSPLPKGEGHYRGGFDFSGQLDLARKLRAEATPAEQTMWELLRDRRFLGLKFRRQHQVGGYVVDFYCDEKKLVVELDGPVHDSSQRLPIDEKRDAYLRSLGLTVIRIKNETLLNKTGEALAEIAAVINPSFLGRGARGEGPAHRLRDRREEVLFIDARKMGRLVDRTHRELTNEEVTRIANTYHAWRTFGPHPNPLPAGEGHYRGGFDFSGMVETARELRRKQTPTEAIMWELLRDRRCAGLKFRRQHRIGEYIADFYCDERKLIVELDGPVHTEPEQVRKDKKRDAYFRCLGLTVLRIRNDELVSDVESILRRIAEHTPSPAGRGEGGEGNPGLSAYADIPGFCKSATLEEIRKHGHVLTPGRYVGAEAVEDDGEPFEEKMKRLTTTLRAQQAEAAKLDAAIAANLKELGYG